MRYYLRFWRWVAVFACSMLNRTLWDEQSTYVVTQSGPTASSQDSSRTERKS